MNTSNELLKNLYRKSLQEFKCFTDKFSEDCLHGPLLISLSSYYDQNTKFMIIGQETYGWAAEYTNINAQISCYEDFNMGENYTSSPFWNITRKVEALFENEPYSCAWSNLNRFDHNGGSPKGNVELEIPKFDQILAEEIKILKPDLCLFYTNHKYDWRLKQIYTGLSLEEIHGLPTKHFCKLSHPDLPLRSFRTPHPKTMRMQGWENDFIGYLSNNHIVESA
jgi:hypothetical protein